MSEYLDGVNCERSRESWPITSVQFAPHAPEQKPIEDIWLQVKSYVRKHWFQCDTFQHVTQLFEEALATLTFDFKKLRMYLPNLQMIWDCYINM